MKRTTNKSEDNGTGDRRSFVSAALGTCAITHLAPWSLQLATSLGSSLTKLSSRASASREAAALFSLFPVFVCPGPEVQRASVAQTECQQHSIPEFHIVTPFWLSFTLLNFPKKS